ncbi:phage tail protein [Cohnella boryungensis]|uniref:Phage tail protein n=1 Tax=Cohnella boryungensis TaxID=768479 RepID=A0ABV8S951_9BACL
MSFHENKYDEPAEPRMFLARPNRTLVGEIHHYFGLSRDTSLGNPSTLDFRVPYQISKFNKLVDNPIAALLKNRYIIKMVDRDFEEWFMIRTPVDHMEEESDFKTITAYSMEIELQDKRLMNYNVTSRNASQILQDVLSQTIWSIGTVLAEFDLKYRSLDITSSSVLDAIYELAKTFDALVTFDTVNRKVSLVQFDKYGVEDGFEASYGVLLKHAKKVDSDEEFYTRFVGVGENGLGIQRENVTGQAYLEDYSYFMYPFERDANRQVVSHSEYMSDELCHALLDYRAVVDSYKGSFQGYLSSLAAQQTTLSTQKDRLDELDKELRIIEDQLSIANSAQETAKAAGLAQQRAAKLALIQAQNNAINSTEAAIKVTGNQIRALQQQMSIESNFTPELIVEWNPYIIEGRYENTYITDVRQLLESTIAEFDKVKQPKILVEIGIVNFYKCLTETNRRLRLGDIIKITNTAVGINVKAKVIGMRFDYDSDDISLTISNVQELLTDKARALRDLYKATTTSGTVTSNLYKWNTASTDVNEVQSVLNGVWDAAAREILASGNESVEISRKGIITKDLEDPQKYVVMQHGQIALTDDGGNSWKSVLNAQGLYAQRLYGQILAGQNLQITNPAGSVVINENGLRVTNMTLTLVNSAVNSQVLINPNDGFKVQKNTGTTTAPVWANQISLDSSGNALFGGILSIGKDNNIVKADGSTGLWVGHASYGSAPFRVDLGGRVTASNVALTGGSIGWGNFNVSSTGIVTATGANISGNIMANALVAGAFIQAPNISGGTITGATIQTKNLGSYPRAAISVADSYFEVSTSIYDYIKVNSIGDEGRPGIRFGSGSVNNVAWISYYNTNLEIGASNDLTRGTGIRMFAKKDIFLAGDEEIRFVTGSLNWGNQAIATQEWVLNNVISKWG